VIILVGYNYFGPSEVVDSVIVFSRT